MMKARCGHENFLHFGGRCGLSGAPMPLTIDGGIPWRGITRI